MARGLMSRGGMMEVIEKMYKYGAKRSVLNVRQYIEHGITITSKVKRPPRVERDCSFYDEEKWVESKLRSHTLVDRRRSLKEILRL